MAKTATDLAVVPPVEALEGEVVITNDSTPAAKLEALATNEKVIKKNWKAATDKVANVYKALTVIHTFDLWKQHKDANGKRKYSAFDKYLFGEFGWELSRVRALQIIKATRAEMIEAGELDAEAAEPRQRSAPEVTSERAAKVTADQLQKALDAFGTRVDNIDEGDPEKALVTRIFNDVRDALAPAIVDLREVVAAAEAAATPATDADDDDDDDSDDDDDNA
jgi:hypothetical protein